MIMNIEKFSDKVIEKVKEILGEGYKIEKNEVTKTNDIKLNGLCFVEEGKNYGPTVYLNHYFEEYENKEKNLVDIAQKIADIVVENKDNQSIMQVGESFRVYEEVKDKIYLKILNKDMNQNILLNSPYEELLDLIIVPYIKFSEDGYGAC